MLRSLRLVVVRIRNDEIIIFNDNLSRFEINFIQILLSEITVYLL
jgi:hypothetical protein